MFEDPLSEILSDEFVLNTALESCVRRGCTCEPEIRIHREGKAKLVSILHDSWCFVLQNPDQN